MQNHRTLFGRSFKVNIAVIAFTVLLLIVVLSVGIRSFYITDAVSALKESGELLNEVYVSSYGNDDAGKTIKEIAGAVCRYQASDIEIYDRYGYVWISCTGGDMLLAEREDIKSDNLQNIEGGYAYANENNVYSTPIVTVQTELRVDGQLKGYVVQHQRLNAYEKTMRIVFKRVIFCTALSLIVALALSLLSNNKTKRVLNSINYAARAFARGDFEARVDIKGAPRDLANLADSFNNMAESLQKYESTRQSFVANVSHELKSPLTSIQGFVQGMLDGTIEQKDQPQYLNIVLQETKRMNLLVVDLLDLAKIESGQFPLQMTQFDIAEELRRTLIRFLTKIEDKNIEVIADIPEEKLMVKADQSRIAQVLTNLVDNAVKFCNRNGTLKIWIYEADGRAHVNIANSGAYIPEEDLPYVFDRFFKVDKSHNRKSPGTGIGLSIVKNIIVQHGEKIWVNSRMGTGTVFTFTLRIAQTGKKPTKGGK